MYEHYIRMYILYIYTVLLSCIITFFSEIHWQSISYLSELYREWIGNLSEMYQIYFGKVSEKFRTSFYRRFIGHLPIGHWSSIYRTSNYVSRSHRKSLICEGFTTFTFLKNIGHVYIPTFFNVHLSENYYLSEIYQKSMFHSFAKLFLREGSIGHICSVTLDLCE